ncbi:MAG: ABC transporter ATP-binding protein [Pseudomonadota bacterium]
MFKVVKEILPFFRFYPWSLPAISVLGILASLAEGIGIGLFIPFLESLDQTGGYESSGSWLVDSLGRLFNSVPSPYRLLVISMCIFSSVVLKASLSYGNQVLFHWLDARIVHQLRSGIVARLFTVNYRFLESTETGHILNTLSNETWRSSEALSELVKFIANASTVIIYVLLLLLISWKLTLLVVVVMVVISMIARWITRHAQELGHEATQASAEATVREIECVEGMKVIRAYGREPYEQQCFNESSERASKSIMRVSITRESITPVYEILAAAFLVFILYSTLKSAESLTALLVFVFILYRLQPLVKMLDESRTHILSLGGAVKAVTSLLNQTDNLPVTSGQIPFHDLQREIRFDHVNFRYDPQEPLALENISICLPVNKTTALVGRSGSGKSTLIHLILRLYEAEAGEIRVDDRLLAELELVSWRSHIAVVSQEVYIFNNSVRDNIAYGRPEASDEEIIAAARQAEADEFIRALPEGYDTKLGERGVRLSGGQQQRIALARAIIRDPDILILDEATNALDSISENLIQTALRRLQKNRTMIIIAHRLSTVQHADNIIVLEHGKVAEQGAFRQLLEQDGLFSRLYNSELRP